MAGWLRKMPFEPGSRLRSHLFERAGLLEQMGGAGHDEQLLFASQVGEGRFVQFDDAEIQAASLQFVRKVSGLTRPSQANQAAFDHAVDEIAQVVRELIDSLVTTAAPHDRAVEAEKARRRSAKRFGRVDTRGQIYDG